MVRNYWISQKKEKKKKSLSLAHCFPVLIFPNVKATYSPPHQPMAQSVILIITDLRNAVQ